MGKSAHEIVSAFVSEMGIQPIGKNQKNLLKFAEAIILMEEDAKKLKPSLRNCQYYSEEKVAKEFRISHGTFQNDKSLHMMANWYLEKKKAGLDTGDKNTHVKELEKSLKMQRKQMEGLIAQQIKFDSLCVELESANTNVVKQTIRFRRAMEILKQYRLDALVEIFVSPEDISAFKYGLRADSLSEGVPCNVLVQYPPKKNDV